MKNLLDYGARINASAGHKGTALHMAIDIESLALVRWMLSNGADLNARSRSYGTPLMNAGRTSHESTIQLLLRAKPRGERWTHDLGEAMTSAVLGGPERDTMSETTRKELELMCQRDEGDEDERSTSEKREAVIRLLM